MKKIKIKICNLNEKDKTSYGYFLLNLLKKFYEVELSENPDYLFFNESDYSYLNYNCIKIFYTGENISPNFNLCDYAIGFDCINFSDRYFRHPLYLVNVFYGADKDISVDKINFVNSTVSGFNENKNKTDFCSFVYSNYLASPERKIFFDKLNSYKKINSGGKYLNNINKIVDSKLNFESFHKFSIAFENSSRSGYTTEKIVCSLVANTIPIYWGNPDIGREFNVKRFINCHDFENFDDVIKRIIEIDSNEDMYLSILNEPWMNNNFDINKINNDLESFLRNIIDQPLLNATRRSINPARLATMERNELLLFKIIKIKNFFRLLLSNLYKPFKKIKFIENIKYKIFSRN